MKRILLLVLTILNYFFLNAQNGVYQVNGYFFHPTSSRTINLQKTISKIDSNSYEIDLADLGSQNYKFQFDIDLNNNLVNWVAIGSAPIAPESGFMTLDNPGSFTYYPDTTTGYFQSTYNNRYDPLTKTFYMHYGYAVGAANQSQYSRQIYEKYVLFSAPPTLTSFTPATGTAGTVVTIHGHELSNTSSVYFANAISDTFMVISDSVLQVVAGSGSTGQIFVTNVAGADSIGNFIYTPPTVSNTQWQYIGNAGFSGGTSYDVNMALTKNNVPYVVYIDSATGMANVKKFVGGAWIDVGTSVSLGKCSSTHIVINKNEEPYVSYADSTLSNARITVRKFNGTNWENVGTPGFGRSRMADVGYAAIADLALDNNDLPYVISDSFDYLTVIRFNGTSWQSSPYLVDTLTTEAALTFNNADSAAYVIYGNANYKPIVRKYNGTGWAVVGNARYSDGNIFYPRIAIDSLGTFPTTAFQDDDGFERASVYQLMNGTWRAGNSKRFSKSHSYNLSLNLYNKNLPIVLFSDGSYNMHGTVVKYNASGSWDIVGDRGFAPTTQFGKHSLAINANNTPYIAFRDASNGNRISVMSYIGSLLPLDFTSFTVNRQSNVALLKWKTAKEINTAYFNVQKSINGIEFATIKKINAAGIGNGSYSYVDDISSVKGPIIYYRLQSLDKDGKFHYSDTKSIRKEDKPLFTIMPNPARDYIFIKGNNVAGVKIMNVLGKQILFTRDNQINISSLVKGVYFIHILDQHGFEQVEKVVVD